jgi:hypothetical protein
VRSKLHAAWGRDSERAVRTRRSEPTVEPVETSRSSRLQGFAPLTSPWHHTAVARSTMLDPSMGFVFPTRCSSPRTNPTLPRRRAPVAPAEADSPSALAVENHGKPRRPMADGIPPRVAPPPFATEAASEEGETRGRSRPNRPTFSVGSWASNRALACPRPKPQRPPEQCPRSLSE